jgi:hypothetical protein
MPSSSRDLESDEPRRLRDNYIIVSRKAPGLHLNYTIDMVA